MFGLLQQCTFYQKQTSLAIEFRIDLNLKIIQNPDLFCFTNASYHYFNNLHLMNAQFNANDYFVSHYIWVAKFDSWLTWNSCWSFIFFCDNVNSVISIRSQCTVWSWPLLYMQNESTKLKEKMQKVIWCQCDNLFIFSFFFLEW